MIGRRKHDEPREREWPLTPLPAKAADGTYPALEYTRVTIARDIIRSRRRLGLSQTDLARQAGIRAETLNRIERAKMTPSEKVMTKLDVVLGEDRTA